jgi:hypothetical protein
MPKKKSRTAPSPDAFNIFVQAVKMYEAQQLLYNHAPKGSTRFLAMVNPSIVLCSFACELFLKCLTYLEKGHVPRGHDLKSLYDGLSNDSRGFIEERWDRHTTASRELWDKAEKGLGVRIPRKLHDVLTAQGRGFEHVRYLYERTQWPYAYYLFDLPPMIGARICQLKPTWLGELTELPMGEQV